MNNQVTIAQLQQMKLKGMAEYYHARPLHGKDGGSGDPVQEPQAH